MRLADKLSKTSGKKVYGYLKADVKAMIISIVDELAADERIVALYELWYERREEVIRTYTDEMPERVPLSQNKEFKSIKNAVIQEAMNIIADRTPIEEAEEQPAPDPEPSDAETEPVLTGKEKTFMMWKFYRQAKELLDKESESYDPNTAIEFLIESAKLGCGVAKYRLGKMFLRGDEVAKNVDDALRWLEESVSAKNQYAEYLLGKTYLKRRGCGTGFDSCGRFTPTLLCTGHPICQVHTRQESARRRTVPAKYLRSNNTDHQIGRQRLCSCAVSSWKAVIQRRSYTAGFTESHRLSRKSNRT